MTVGPTGDSGGFDFAQSLRDITAVAPTLTHAPAVAVAAAQANLGTNQVEQVAAYQRGQMLMQFMAGQDPDAQKHVYEALSNDDKVLITQAGYQPPKQGRSIFGTVTNALGAPLRAVQHGYRAVSGSVAGTYTREVWHDMFGGLRHPSTLANPNQEKNFQPGRNIATADQAGNLQTTAGGWGAWNFTRAWRATTNGQRTFDAKSLNSIQDKYDSDTYNLALHLAEGDTIQQLAGGDQNRLTKLNSIANGDQFKQAYADVEAAHISPGRDFANGLGLTPGKNAATGGFGARLTDPYTLVSGSTDALADWFGDPTLGAGKLAHAGMALKWGLRANDATRVEQLMAKPAAQRGWNYIIDRLNTVKNSDDAVTKGQALDEIRRNFPTTLNLIDPLIQDAKEAAEDVSLEGVTNYLSGADGMARMAIGMAARETPTLPGRLSKFGEAHLAITDNLHKAIDFLADGKKYLPYDRLTPEAEATAEGSQQAAEAFGKAAFDYRKTLAGRMKYTARRLITRVPSEGVLDVTSPDSIKFVRQTALTYLPTSRANEIAAAFAGADLAGKRAVYKGMLQELGHASGMMMTKSGSEWWLKFMGDLDAEDARETYSALGNDSGVFVRDTGSGKRSLAGVAAQVTQKWALPAFKDMQAHAAKIGVMDRIAGGINHPWIDNMMGKWRTSVLYRFAFALRVSLEDVFSQFWAGQGNGVLQARVATSLAARSAPGEAASPLARTIGKVVDGVSSALGSPSNGSEVGAHYALAKIGSVFNKGASLVLDPDYKFYITKLFDGAARERMSKGVIDEARGAARGAGDETPEDITANVQKGKVSYRPNGDFTEQNAQGMNGALRWAYNLEHGSSDLVARHVLLNPEVPFEEMHDEMLALMKSPEYEPVLKGAEIANWTKDGRSVAAGEATQDEALGDWAQDIYTNFQHLIRDSKGNLIKPLAGYIKKSYGDTPSAEWLNQRVKNEAGHFTSEPLIKERPDTVVGPEFVPYTKPTAANLIQLGWDKMIAGPMNWLSRQPILFHEYVQARKVLKPIESAMLDKGMGEANVERLIDTRAQMIAQAKAIKYIHNPALRSQFSVLARNLFPFRHAEESALQRWASRMVFSPEGFRRAQLLMGGLHHSGLVTKDSQGNDYIVFPGSAALVNLGAKIANVIPGVHVAELPIKANMGFQLQFVSPFLSEFGGIGTGSSPAERLLSDAHPLIPPGGPVVGMSMGLLNHFFPESRAAQDVRGAFISKQGQGKPFWQDFVPSTVSRFYQAIGNGDDANSQLASSMRNAAAYMEAAGLTPGPNATSDQVDQYITRLRSWSRNLLVMRGVLGLVSPAAPGVDQFSPDADTAFALEGVHSLSDEFYKMTETMPYEEALQSFIAMHPDDSPFTVAQSQSSSGARLSATTATLDWIDGHAGLIQKYPSVAPFLMPLDSGSYNYDAYKEQLAIGMRQKKSVKQFYTDLKVRTASDTYYQARDNVQAAEAQLAAQGNHAAVGQLQKGFSIWSQQFQAVNPLFADYLAAGGERQTNKLQAVQQLQMMTDSGDLNGLVGSTEADTVKQILGAWNEWIAVKQQLYGRSDQNATNMRKSMQAGVGLFIQQATANNPQLQGLYSTVFAPLLGTS